MTELLSAADVARLLTDPSAEARGGLASKLGPMLNDERLTPAELSLAQDIVRRLARDVETEVRRALSHSIRHASRLPREVAVRLANDIEAVALPILTDSLVLTDEDLIDLVRGGSVYKQTAIAGRAGLSSQVSDTIAAVAHEKAVIALMANDTATLSERSLTMAIDRFPGSSSVTESMARRSVLPMTVAERLVTLVSRRLQDHLVRNHALSPSTATDIVLQGRERAIIQLSAGADEAELQRLVSQMHHSGRLTPTLVLRALCTGDIAFFEVAMATLAQIPLGSAQILIHDPGGLVSLCQKAGMPAESMMLTQAAVAAIDSTRFDGEPRDLERYRGKVLARALTQVETMGFADAAYLVDKLSDVLQS